LSGSIESISVIFPLLAIHLVSAARLQKEIQLYPHVFGVLFNPYTGDVILMREDWKSFLKMKKIPTLIPVHIPLEDAKKYKIVPTSQPQGCVIHREEDIVEEGKNVSKHYGYLHFSNIFNHDPFDNYMNEMASNKILEQMITIRFEQDHRYYKPEDIYQHLDGLMTWETGKLSPDFVANVERRQIFEEKMLDPKFRHARDLQERRKFV
jgi:hypothetical protein